MENTRTVETIKEELKQLLESNWELFDGIVDELDSWNGYADGFRCYDMSELEELCYGMSLSEFLDKITSDFNHNDDYLYFSIYGIESTNDKHDLYSSNVWTSELIDNLIDNGNNLNIDYLDGSDELNELLDELEELEE